MKTKYSMLLEAAGREDWAQTCTTGGRVKKKMEGFEQGSKMEGLEQA